MAKPATYLVASHKSIHYHIVANTALFHYFHQSSVSFAVLFFFWEYFLSSSPDKHRGMREYLETLNDYYLWVLSAYKSLWFLGQQRWKHKERTPRDFCVICDGIWSVTSVPIVVHCLVLHRPPRLTRFNLRDPFPRPRHEKQEESNTAGRRRGQNIQRSMMCMGISVTFTCQLPTYTVGGCYRLPGARFDAFPRSEGDEVHKPQMCPKLEIITTELPNHESINIARFLKILLV